MSQFAIETIADIPWFKASGRLDATNSIDFEKAVTPVINETIYLIIDMANCSYLSSAGIRILLKSHKQLLSKQGKLIVSGMIPEVFQVIEMAGLHRIFNLSETPEKAADAIVAIRSDITTPHTFEWNHQSFEFIEDKSTRHPLYYWQNNCWI